jgi:hemolysin activation/secretion protein
MKKLFIVSAFLLAFSMAKSQNPLPVGRAQFNAGLGFSGWGVPVYAGVDFGVQQNITLGGELSVRSYRENWKSNYYRHNIIGISANGNYHFNTVLDIPRQYDFYAGLNVGFYVWNSPDGYPGNHSSGLGLGAQIGGRYYFTNKVGLNVEVGGGDVFSDGKIGLTFKL